MVALALLLLLVAMVARRVAATEAPDAKVSHFVNFCRLQRNRQPSLPPKTRSLIRQKRVRMGASLPIPPHYPYSDSTEPDFRSRAEGKRGRD